MKKLSAALVTAALALAFHTGAHAQAKAPRPSRNRISTQEIAEARTNSVYELIQSKRGFWLSRLGNTGPSDVLVFLDSGQLGGLDELKSVPSLGLASVEFLDAGQAYFRFGKPSHDGAIVVHTTSTAADSARESHSH
jgi:hypothetical protein